MSEKSRVTNEAWFLKTRGDDGGLVAKLCPTRATAGTREEGMRSNM